MEENEELKKETKRKKIYICIYLNKHTRLHYFIK